MSLINYKIQPFSVKAFHNEQFKDVTEARLVGKWSVFFFYPADFTFVCPTELEDLQNWYSTFKQMGCEIYSISTDTHFTHKAWHDSSERIQKITYPMLADPTHVLCNQLGTLIEESGMSERATFIINPDLQVVAYEFSSGNVGRDAQELLRKVQALQFVREHGDEVCPASWKPGEKTLKPSLNLVGKL